MRLTEQTGATLKALEGTIRETTKAKITTKALVKNLDDPQSGIRATLKEPSQTLEKTRVVLDGVDATIQDFRQAHVVRWIMHKRTKNDATPSAQAAQNPPN